jgi:UPF0755 protein
MTYGRGRPVGERPDEIRSRTVRSDEYVPRGRPGGGVVRGRGFRDAPETRSSGRAAILRFLLFTLGLAAAVIVFLVTVGAPLLGDTVYGFATSRPESMRWPFVASIVEQRLGTDLTAPGGTDTTEVRFTVEGGATATQIGQKLEDAGLLRDHVAFVYLVVTEDRSSAIETGTYRLNATMTPQQIIDALQNAPVKTVTIALREGLRVEQIVAYLKTLPLETDIAKFYELASHPPATLLADFSWLEIPEGRSLEGFLAPDTYEVWEDITPTDLIRLLVNNYHKQLGDDLLQRIAAGDRSLYEVVTLASLVDKEAKLDEERPIIAGVFQNRLAKKMLLNADPTVIYAKDSIELAKLPIGDWPDFYFWAQIKGALASFDVPAELAGYQTYQKRGLPPGPICSPRVSSVEAALAPDTSTGYLYFVAIPDGSGAHAFAKTLKEHEANLAKYGYGT